MNPSTHYQNLTKINMEIMSLKEDLRRVHTSSIKRQIENEISQKELRLRIFKAKHLDSISGKTQPLQPIPEKEKARLSK